ncbi:MAG: nucleoside deaminase [Deltaproteobacteria bacterium]|nr:nucleoside deaminase [Deltaproteobacteria bacterium]
MPLDLYYLMTQAILEAKEAFTRGEVPVGAVLADGEGRILTRAHNRPIGLEDPTAHAEILALRSGGKARGNYRLNGAVLVVTIEPCLMCMGAAVNARIARIVFGAHDPRAGAAGSLYRIHQDQRLNHRLEVTPGIMEDECRALMKEFFQARRGKET